MQLSESDKKVADLQSQQIPRRLSQEQKATLLTSLTPFAGQKISIWCSTNAWDCVNFATDFQSVFKQAKWDIPDKITFGMVVGYDAVGIEVLVNPSMASDPNNTPPSVVTLDNYFGKPPAYGGTEPRTNARYRTRHNFFQDWSNPAGII